MKHLLLIFISILLLSSHVIGNNHKGETLYGWGKYPEIVWKGFGDIETHPKYQGQGKNGIPNGLGVIWDPNGSKCVGSWKNGKPWNGTGYDKNGDILYKYVNGEREYQ